MTIVTPWEVKGDLNYDKLIKEFGLLPFPKKIPAEFNEFLLFRRGLIYAHRDFNIILDAVKNKKPFVVMTGLMPSGKLHIGHKMVVEQLIFYQKLGARIYITVADIEAYNARNISLKELRKTAIEEYMTNYAALGLDISKCDFYFQSKRSQDAKKSNAYYRLASLLSRHITFNEFKAVYGDITPGKMNASLLQASDMLHPQLPEFEGAGIPTIIPVGIDQSPHIRIARDMAKRIREFKLAPIASTYHKFCPGLKGGKMSSSDDTSYISLTENPKVAAKKINKYAFSGGRDTLEEHRKLGGNPDIDVAFQMLLYGFEPNDEKLAEIYAEYKSGNLLSGELKKYLIDKVTTFLESHQKKLVKAKKDVEKIVNKLQL